MDYVSLGNTGIKVSKICLGCMSYGSSSWRPWVLDEEASRPFFVKAWESGINFFDTADKYSEGVGEEVLGRAIKELAIPREQVVIATKVFQPTGKTPNEKGLSRKHIRHAVDASLKRLQTDYIDLYQLHRLDTSTPMEEIVETLELLVRAGKVLAVGASSMHTWQFAKLVFLGNQAGFARFVTMQNHYNLIYREEERDMIPFCKDQKIGLLPWSPLAHGFLTGDRGRGNAGSSVRSGCPDYTYLVLGEAEYQIAENLNEVAKEHGVPRAQIALAWVLQKQGVVAPIIGATKLEHLDDAIAAVEIKLTSEQKKLLEKPYKPKPVVGPM